MASGDAAETSLLNLVVDEATMSMFIAVLGVQLQVSQQAGELFVAGFNAQQRRFRQLRFWPLLKWLSGLLVVV